MSNVRQLFAADEFRRQHFQMHFFLGVNVVNFFLGANRVNVVISNILNHKLPRTIFCRYANMTVKGFFFVKNE